MLVLAFSTGIARAQESDESQTVPKQLVTFPSLDGLVVSADLWDSGDRAAPTAVLFHQSISSRGEYASIAPRIAARGWNVLAVDLRWGGRDRWHGVRNETAERFGTAEIVAAVEAGDRSKVWPTIFQAYTDMLAAVDWLAANEFSGQTVVVGSSFSAMLILQLAGDREIDGVVAFSPGEYHDTDSTMARRWASTIEVPVLIVGGADEEDLIQPVFDALRSPVRMRVVTEDDGHGAAVLADAQEGWNPFVEFLDAFGKPAEVSFTTEDGVTVFADWYTNGSRPSSGKTALLLHQGGSNARAEYASAVPILRLHGFDALAVDLRRGGDRFGGANRTVAALQDAQPSYCDAASDVTAALDHLAALGRDPGVVVVGSSFSAALAIQVAATAPDRVERVVAFSPASGEPMSGCEPDKYVAQLSIPVLAVRPAHEIHFGSVNEQLNRFRDAGVQTYVASNGVHGSSMLNPRRVVGSVNPNWDAVLRFLESDF